MVHVKSVWRRKRERGEEGDSAKAGKIGKAGMAPGGVVTRAPTWEFKVEKITLQTEFSSFQLPPTPSLFS
jgi:hypothetical protein